MPNFSNAGVFYWKGKRLSEAVYKQRLAQQKAGKNSKKNTLDDEAPYVVQGYRMIHVETVKNGLKCTSCGKVLSLDNITKETLVGFASIWHVKCDECLLENFVYTSPKIRNAETKSMLFEVNFKAVMGVLHSGSGLKMLQKFCACLDMHSIVTGTFKLYERLVGQQVEKVAKESCHEAAKIEKSLTVENKDEIEKMLPQDLRKDFIIPKVVTTQSKNTEQNDSVPLINEVQKGEANDYDPNNNDANDYEIRKRDSSHGESKNGESNDGEYFPNSTTKKPEIISGEKEKISTIEGLRSKDFLTAVVTIVMVRLMLSFDMAWSKRGSGRNYDSLNGYGAMFGTQSGLIIDYGTRNRLCKMCLLGHPKSDHDCRQNFTGSAKAMEADLAADIAANSEILREHNLQLGILCGDEDSCAIAAIRANSSHPVVKLSDRNHLNKGLKKILYQLLKSSNFGKELNGKTIDYLFTCFTYATAQHHGDSAVLATAVRNIPEHAFNNHDGCVTSPWCEYKYDPENYSHKTIGEGLKNPKLYSELTKIFNGLAANSDKFAFSVSSQANESLNSAISRKAPKALCYSQSESMDFRVASAVAEKNLGEEYIRVVYEKLHLNAGELTKKYISRVKKIKTCKRAMAKTVEFKRKRIELKKIRTELRHKNESKEGVTYQSNVGLLSTPAVNPYSNENADSHSHGEKQFSNDYSFPEEYTSENHEIIFFDLETSSLSSSCDILQIAAGKGSLQFNCYVNPIQSIHPKTTEVNGLTNNGGELYLRGVRVKTYPLKIVLGKLLIFLGQFHKPCVLVAHNCVFDASRLVRDLKKLSLLDDFKSVVAGFFCSLISYKDKFPGRKFKRGDCKLVTLVSPLVEDATKNAHDAAFDIYLLETFVRHEFSVEYLISKSHTVDDFVNREEKGLKLTAIKMTLRPLVKIISAPLREKLAEENLTMAKLQAIFDTNGEDGIIELFTEKINNKPRISKSKNVLQKVITYFKSQK